MTGSVLRSDSQAGIVVARVAEAPGDGDDCLVFVAGRKEAGRLAGLHAAAVLISPDIADQYSGNAAVIVSKAPHAHFAAVARMLYPQALAPRPLLGIAGISADATIAASAVLEDGVTVEAGARIGGQAEIGKGTVIGPNAVIGEGVTIGRNCMIGPSVSIQAAHLGDSVFVHDGARIGAEGFGFTPGPTGLEKIPQIGRVIIQDRAEIGANTTVDRGALGDTVIGEGSKIDNLCQIAHNVRIGRHTVIAGKVGISGSCTIGDMVMIGGGVGLADHLKVGNGAQIAAGSGIMHDIPAGERWAGYPAKPMADYARELVTLSRLAKRKRREGSEDK